MYLCDEVEKTILRPNQKPKPIKNYPLSLFIGKLKTHFPPNSRESTVSRAPCLCAPSSASHLHLSHANLHARTLIDVTKIHSLWPRPQAPSTGFCLSKPSLSLPLFSARISRISPSRFPCLTIVLSLSCTLLDLVFLRFRETQLFFRDKIAMD